MPGLTIHDRRDRAIVRTADALLLPLALARRIGRPQPRHGAARILCLRLERIGDLLMTLPALSALRAAYRSARIDLVVGSWNAPLAEAIIAVDRVHTVDAAWLARGRSGQELPTLLARAVGWRKERYDLGINFEPDIRTNMLLSVSGARRTVGFASGGGGALLDTALDFDTGAHTSMNALALVRAVAGEAAVPPIDLPLLISDDRRKAAAALLAEVESDGPLIGVHVSGGREVKQWPEERFAEVAVRLVQDRAATIVFSGGPEDREQIGRVRQGLPPSRVLDLSGVTDLLTLAAVFERLRAFITGDTGPMHLAHAMRTPIVAIFGPSAPNRYAPAGVHDRVVRVDLPCSPCNRIRTPPARCTGHPPDCLTSIDVSRVLAAVDEILHDTRSNRQTGTPA